ncbi:MAG: efflux RND transporter periplasmic adaptor subunit [Gemmatimonadota bacterium]
MRRPVFALGLAIAVVSCGSGGDGAAAAPPHVPVGLATVTRDTITATVRLVGRLVPLPGGTALLAAPTDAVVQRIAVQVGQAVRPGAVLVELDAPELVTRVVEARAGAEVAEHEARRQQDLYDQGITSRKQLEEKLAAARAARSAASAAEQLLERTHVASPIGGGVQRVLVHQGERVTAGTPLVEVVNGSVLDLQVEAPPADLRQLRMGQVARVVGEGQPDVRPGTVIAIAPAVDSLSNAARVILRIPEPGPALRAGMGAVATVITGLKRDVLVVPDSALVLVGDAMSVFVVGPGSVARARAVRVGVRSGGRAEVMGDLKPGDRVVTTGAFGLSDGMLVVPEAPEKRAQ